MTTANHVSALIVGGAVAIGALLCAGLALLAEYMDRHDDGRRIYDQELDR